MDDWWDEIDREVLEALKHGPATPAEIGRRLGMSEHAAASLLGFLVSQKRVRIRLVELVTSEEGTEPATAAGKGEGRDAPSPPLTLWSPS
jgi:predicted ArsR family transcriptional regulator